MPYLPSLPEQHSAIILHAVREHEKQVGVGSLALVLKGSKSKIVINRRLHHSPFFGALFYYPLDVLENFIRQLLEKKMMQTMLVTGNPYPFPMLGLTAEGIRIVENKIDVPLEIRRTIKPVVLNDSIKETLRFFHEEKEIVKIAQKRNLAESTVWKHLIDAVKLGQISAMEVVDKEKMKIILGARNSDLRLKELKEKLPAEISYEEIRCVLAEEADHDPH